MTKSRGRAQFGVLVHFTNTNLEPDLALMRPDGVSLHFARLGGYDQTRFRILIRWTGWVRLT